MKYLAILGASDPEMEAIETLLRECGVTVVCATHGGPVPSDSGPVAADPPRVHPGNAYRADVPLELSEQWDGVIAVECAWRDMPEDIVRADHHRHGDYGYGLPPSEFLQASSLGQVITWLARTGALSHIDHLITDGWAFRFRGNPGGLDCRWQRADVPWGGWQIHHADKSYTYSIPRDLVLTAAADHCLGAAYRGECPGVDPDELLAHRVANRARYQHRIDSERGAAKGDVAHYESLIRERIEAARRELREAPHIELGPELDARDMRRDTLVPELAEAATWDGVAYVAGPFAQPDGRRKFTCSGDRRTVEAFMSHWAPANGLTDIYGDPARGFAGGHEA